MDQENVNDQDQEQVENSGSDNDSETTQTASEQSETTEGVEEAKTEPFYVDHLGRELSAEQLKEEYSKTSAYITKLEQNQREREASAERDATRKIEENELLKNVDPNVKEAIIQMVKPVITETLLEKEREAEQKAANEAFDRKLDKLESDYPGGNGLPKFDRRVVLKAMQDPNNEIYDPEAKFYMMNRATFEDHLIKQALKTKKAGPETETTSSEAPEKPSSPSPKTLSEASKRAYERLRSS